MLKRSYYGLLATITLSSFGDAFGLLAMEWLVYELTASKLAMGALALCYGIPELVFRLIGSPYPIVCTVADSWPDWLLYDCLPCFFLSAWASQDNCNYGSYFLLPY